MLADELATLEAEAFEIEEIEEPAHAIASTTASGPPPLCNPDGSH
ncbi:hypothetical protein [Streptomyces albiaxialis]